MSSQKNHLPPVPIPWLSSLMPLSLGIGLAALTGQLLLLVPPQPRLAIFVVGLAAIGTVYVGAALAEQRRRSIALETSVAAICIVLAFVGLWGSPLALIGGYLLHGVWDFFHHPVPVGASLSQRWYPPLCLGFDWAIAIVISLQLG